MDPLVIPLIVTLFAVAFLFVAAAVEIKSLRMTVENLRKDHLDLVIETNHRIKDIDRVFLDVAVALDAMSSFISTRSRSNSKKMMTVKKSKEYFNEINEITKEQMTIYGSLQGPSASASHSKYRNDIIAQFKELERKKREIMQKLVDQGVDPMIHTMDGAGNLNEIRMSELLKTDTDIFGTTTPTDQKTPRKKQGNVISLFNEENDDEPSDPTLH